MFSWTQKSSGATAVTALEIAWLALSLTTIVGMTVLLIDKRLRRWSSFIGNRLAMRTTILAYVIAIFGLALLAAGAWDIYVLSQFEVTLSDYGVSIRTIAGGFIMIGLAQALRLLLEITVRIK